MPTRREGTDPGSHRVSTLLVGCWKGRTEQAAEKPVWPVIPRSPPFLLVDDEESCTALKILRARFLAPLGMTAWRGFSAACSAPPFGPSALRKSVGLVVVGKDWQATSSFRGRLNTHPPLVQGGVRNSTTIKEQLTEPRRRPLFLPSWWLELC
jgi:hypothetical protein